jgi:hypothetical protein
LWPFVTDTMVDPHLLPHRLADNRYRYILSHNPAELLEDVALAVRARVWRMRDGAPAHFSRAVRGVLSYTCHDRRIGNGGHTAWPPRSPDLNPLHFYLWGHLFESSAFLPVGTPIWILCIFICGDTYLNPLHFYLWGNLFESSAFLSVGTPIRALCISTCGVPRDDVCAATNWDTEWYFVDISKVLLETFSLRWVLN